MLKANKSHFILLLVIIIFIAGFIVSLNKIKTLGVQEIDSFEKCASAGFPVKESFPRSCTDGNGNSFTENVPLPKNAITNEKVHVFYPTPGTILASPISFSGEAKGSWYFEGSFPVEVRDSTGKTVAKAVAHANSKWMTDKFVPFDDVIAVPLRVDTGDLYLVLKRDNPSGDPKNNEEVVIPIKYIRR